jgi:hypothetical protein
MENQIKPITKLFQLIFDLSKSPWLLRLNLLGRFVFGYRKGDNYKSNQAYKYNIEKEMVLIEPESINMILYLDLLGHLINPHRVVAYLHALLAPEELYY